MTASDLTRSERGGISKFVFMLLAWALVACIVAQTFIAGLAIFQDSAQWRTHVIFVHLFEYLPLLMLIFAFVGRMPGRTRWQCLALFLLIFSQYTTANLPGAGALHPVTALALIVLALHVALKASRR